MLNQVDKILRFRKLFVALSVLATLSLGASRAGAQDPADATDPFIVAQAAALQNDPNQIFAFVRDQIKFEAYAGSVRGARGTLWSRAGNTLDKSSLLVALLGAAGFPAQYQHALNFAGIPGLISSMFDSPTQFIGCIPPQVGKADPRFDGQFTNDIYNYYWVKYSGIDLDPNQPTAQPGQAFFTPDASFTSVPQDQRQKVTVRVVAETYSQAYQLFGLGPGTSTVLTQTFDASALVGRILSVGNFVQGSSGGGLDLTATTFTYTPYLLVGSGGADVSQDQVITGANYQELYTNFPLGSTVLTGLFVEIDALDAHYQPKTYRRTIFDRLGPAGRQGLAPVSLSLPIPPAPAVTDYDITTVNVLTSRQPLAGFQAQQTRLNTALQRYLAIKPQLAAIPTNAPLTADQQAIVHQALALGHFLLLAQNELITMGYNAAADALTSQLEVGYFSRIFPISPRITIAQSGTSSTGDAVFRLDVLKNDMRTVPGIGQSVKGPYLVEVARGMLESLLEGRILSKATGKHATGIGEVLAALDDASLLTVIGPHSNTLAPADIPVLDRTSLSADAKALILNAVTSGLTVVTPTRMVTVDGVETAGWFETDQYGHTISHFADGGHQAIVGYIGELASLQKYNATMAKFIGQVEGVGVTGIAFAGAVLQGIASNTSFEEPLKEAKEGLSGAGEALEFGAKVFESLEQTLEALETILDFEGPNLGGVSLIASFSSGLADGIKQAQGWLKRNLPFDPPALAFIGTPLGPPPADVTPGGAPGAQVDLHLDPYFTSGVNGIEVPVIYQAFVSNTGPAADTFKFEIAANTASFYVYPNVPSLTLASGQTGLINVCVTPYDPAGLTLPPVGAQQPFTLRVRRASTNDIISSTDKSFAAPAIPSLQVTVDPKTLVLSPGGTVQATLTLTGGGNAAPGSVELTAAAPNGLTLDGLTSPVVVPLNGTATETISFTAAPAAALATYTVPVTAKYTAAGSQQQIVTPLAVTVVNTGQCAAQASTIAFQMGKPSVGYSLNTILGSMNDVALDPSNATLAAKLVTDMRFMINTWLDAPFLQAQAPALTAATDAFEQSTPATRLAALGALNASLCAFGDVMNQANTYGSGLSITPNSQTSGPLQPAVYTINLQNFSNALRVYDLSVTGVPNGVSAVFNQSSITLGPNDSSFSFSSAITLTLTPGPSFTTPFAFQVVATPHGAPSFAKSASATLDARAEAISLDNVTATPAFVDAGTNINVSVRVFSAVNEPRSAYLYLTILDTNGNYVNGPFFSGFVDLSTAASLKTVTFTAIPTTGMQRGPYMLSIQGYNTSGQTIPGANASGTLFVGAPFTAALTATPSIVPPGSSTVHATLDLTRDRTQNPVSTLLGLAALSGTPKSMALFQNGPQLLAYICADAFVNIVDVTDKTAPSVLGTFAHDLLTANGASGFGSVTCGISGNTLVVSYSRENGNSTAAVIPTHFASFSLANPLAPAQVGSVVDIQRPDSSGFYTVGTTALLTQQTVFYNPFSKFIFEQTGDVWALDLTNVASGTVAFQGDLYPSGDPNRGGPSRIFPGTSVTNNIAYFASTDSTGGNTLNPGNPQIHGRLLVVDTTNPASPSIITSVTVPQAAYLTGVAVQGNIAVAVGDSVGVYDALSGFVGNTVIASFDISNPTNPILLNTVVTQLKAQIGASIVPVGSNTFAVGGTTNNNKAVLLLVDASNPNALRYVPYDAVFVASPQIASGSFFYSLSSTSLAIFRLDQVAGPQLSVTLQIPKSGGVSLVPGTFSEAPSSTVSGATADTYVWNQPSQDSITFDVNVTGMNPGDVRDIVAGGQVDFTLPTVGPGKIVLPPLSVLTAQIMRLSPETQHTPAGVPVSYNVTIQNPTASPQTFALSVLGPPGSWVSLPSSVTVARGASETVTLELTPPLSTSVMWFVPTYSFSVHADTADGLSASATGRLFVDSNAYVGSNGGSFIFDYVATASPTQLTIGRGDSGRFAVNVTNTGNTPDYIYLNLPFDLPPGWFVTYSPQNPRVSPGVNNGVRIEATVFVPRFTNPGSYTLHQPVYYFGQARQVLEITVNVSDHGVQGAFSPDSGTPQTTFALTITNTGFVPDTYSLAAVGALSQAAVLDASSVTLDPDQSQTVHVTLDNINYVVPSNASLLVNITSQSVPDVSTVASATVSVPGRKGVSATLAPSPASIASSSSSATLLLSAINTGNLNDAYSVSIAGVTGPYAAALVDAFGLPQQMIAPVNLSALGTAFFPVAVTATGTGAGSVTVTVTSLSDAQVTATATAIINGGTAAQPPIADAGPGGIVPLHRLASLDGSRSADSNQPPLPLSFAWTLVSAPQGSSVTTNAIRFASAAQAAFVPDVPGTYTFQLTVTTSAGSSQANVSFDAQLVMPVAVAGQPANTHTGNFVFLDGKDSYDPNGLPITFRWTFGIQPAGSALTDADIHNATTPRAFFTCDVSGTYSVYLFVHNGTFESLPSPALVTCTDGNIVPTARAGSDRNVKLGQSITLDGSASGDPDSGPQPLSYAWSLESIPNGSTADDSQIANAGSQQAQFTPDAAGDFVFHLHVSDGPDSGDDTVTFHVFARNAPPNADAGLDQFSRTSQTVTLNGSQSSDPDNGPAPLAYNWWFVQRPGTAALTNATTPLPQFSPDATGYYIARVEASDGISAGFANTIVTVAQVCDADANGTLDQIDLALISASFGPVGQHDPRDFDGNGVVDDNDVNSCRAVIEPKVPVTIGTNVAGASFSIDGTTFTSMQVLQVAPGSTITVATTTPQTSGGTRLTFLNWSDGQALSHTISVGDQPLTITANFAVAYQLTETVVGSGHGTVTPGSGGFYAAGSTLTLTAQADSCSALGGFSANAPGGVVTFDSPQDVTITFNDASARLIGTLSPAGQATGPVRFTFGGDRRVTGTNRWRRVYTLTNTGTENLTGVVLALDPPTTNVTSLFNAAGQTSCAAPAGSSYITVPNLAAGQSAQVTLEVVTQNPAQNWTGALRLLAAGKP